MTEELDLERLVAEVTAKVEGTPHRVATILMGSSATGTRRPFSDVDFLVLLDDPEPWRAPVRDGGREAWTDESGVQVEVVYHSLSRMRRYMLAEAERGSGGRLTQLTNGRLLGAAAEGYHKLLGEAEVRLRAGPPPLDAHALSWECYQALVRLREVEGLIALGSPALLVADELFEQLVTLTYRLRRAWPPGRKHLFVEIAEDDDVLGPSARRYPGAADDHERHAVLVELMHKIAEAFGVTFSGVHRSRPPPRT